jgi:predicted DNA-binding transcriptional regulator AlpA
MPGVSGCREGGIVPACPPLESTVGERVGAYRFHCAALHEFPQGTALSLRNAVRPSAASLRPCPAFGFLRTPEAARFLGLSGRTLEKHRTYGTGPKYRKIGGRVVYALDDLKAWADLGAKMSTSDPGAGTVFPAKRLASVPMSSPRRG